jgi:RND family efflux transporter MFP subunit
MSTTPDHLPSLPNGPTHETPILAQPADVTPPAAFTGGGDGANAGHGGNAEHGGAHRVELPPMGTGAVVLMGVAFVGLLGGLFAVGYVPNHRRNAEIEARASERKSDKPVVSVVLPKRAASAPAIELPGTARAFQSTALYPRASGYIRKLNVDIGDKVKMGDTLAEIETPELDAQLGVARATLEQNRAAAARADSDFELATTTLNRYKAFAETGGVTQQQLDEKRSAYEQAKSAQVGAAANVKSGEAEVQRLVALQGFQRVTAPFDGVITARGYDAGALLAGTNASKPLFQLDQTNTIRVFVDVPQSYAPQVRVGNATKFITRAEPNRPFVGAIARTAGAIDETTRTLRVEADFPNDDGRLRPGTYGQVRYEVGTADQKLPLVVPTSALVFDSKGTRLVVVDASNRVSFKQIAVGRDYGTEIEVASGLDGNERVVANPGERVADGVEVEIAQPAAGENKPAVASAPATTQPQAAAR